MLAGLLTALASRPMGAFEKQRCASYLRQFSTWCQALGLQAPPVSLDLIRRYLIDQIGNDKAHLRAVDFAYAHFEQMGPSRRTDLEEVVALLGLTGQPGGGYRLASPHASATQHLYQRRIGRFARWCAQTQQSPTPKSVERWLDSIDAKGSTRAQYKTSVQAWAKMPPAAQPPAQAKPAEVAAPIKQHSSPARARRGTEPLILKTAEKRLIYQLGRTGVAEHHRHALQFAKVRPQRLRTLVRRGYLMETRGLTRLRPGHPLKTVRYYSLGSRGRTWLKGEGVVHLYRWNPQQLRHDLHLTDAYCQLPPAIQRTWITETEVIEQLQGQRRYAPGEAVDAAIMLNGQPYAIEIAIGYSKAAIAKKQACIRDVFNGRGLLVT